MNRSSAFKLATFAACFALVTAACGDSTNGTDDAGGSSEQSTEQSTLDCSGTVAEDVPVFFSTYFRCVDIVMDGDVVVISSTDQPPHPSWYYDESDPRHVAFESRGADYFQNPNTIASAAFTIRIPSAPTETGVVVDTNTVNLSPGDPTDYKMGVAGVALDGVAYFNPLARPGDDIEDEKYSFDLNEGHPQEAGVYHYHAPAPGPLDVLQSLGITTSDIPGVAEVELYGIMCDGTVLLGSSELDGSAVDGELDEQSGHTHDITDADGAVLLENRYHVHMAPSIGAEPRGLSPEAQFYSTCEVTES